MIDMDEQRWEYGIVVDGKVMRISLGSIDWDAIINGPYKVVRRAVGEWEDYGD